MINNYLKISLRNLIRHKGFSSSNIVGLAVGMASCFLILLFVRYEMNWNDSNE
jgi:putative ABC transport system permease protein